MMVLTGFNTANGVQARSVSPDSPLRVYVNPVTTLGLPISSTAIHPERCYAELRADGLVEELDRYLEGQGVGGPARYAIEHPDASCRASRNCRAGYDVDFNVANRQQEVQFYLAFVGVVYLAIGCLFCSSRVARR